VALVTGASRGIGKGVALALGASGATVYVTGRSRRGSEALFPGSIEETAEMVSKAGGTGIAVACDHSVDEQVASVFRRIADETGKLDLLVNNATALPAALIGSGGFWERPLALAGMFDVGLRSSYVASWHAANMMAPAGCGLIASISFYGSVSYFHGPAYGAQKAAVDKMMFDMAVDLKPYNVAALSIWPGLVRTEKVVARWTGQPGGEARLESYETPQYTGLLLHALLHDPQLMSLSGRTLIGAEYGAEAGLVDLDGKQPLSYRQSLGAPHEFSSGD
jgi:NAD(P)-dependent dehydrogenase (short-subunit alcohol dehydrogenase family)